MTPCLCCVGAVIIIYTRAVKPAGIKAIKVSNVTQNENLCLYSSLIELKCPCQGCCVLLTSSGIHTNYKN